MPELNLRIGSRTYQVNCQAGEESFLQNAAALLDEEAKTLVAQSGRLPEPRMLLLAGLMLADKLTEANAKLTQASEELEKFRSAEPETVEIPVIPADLTDAMAELAAQAEALAALAEEKSAP